MKKSIFILLICGVVLSLTGCITTRELRVITDFPEKVQASEFFNKAYNASGLKPLYKLGLVNLPTICIWNLEHHTILITKGFFDQGGKKIVVAAFAHEFAHEVLAHKSKGTLQVKVEAFTEWASDTTRYKVSGPGWGDLAFSHNAVGGYTEQQEVEADCKAIELMKKMGYSKSDYVTYLLFLEEEIKLVEADYLNMHPSLSKRIDILTASHPIAGRKSTAYENDIEQDEADDELMRASVYEKEDAGPVEPYKYRQEPVQMQGETKVIVVQAPGELSDEIKPVLPPEYDKEEGAAQKVNAGVVSAANKDEEKAEEPEEASSEMKTQKKQGAPFVNEVVSGVSAMGIKLGISYDALLAQFGTPAYNKGNTVVYSNDDGQKMIEVFFANTTFNSETVIMNIRIYPANIKEPVSIDGKITTDKGKQEILEALGMPEGFRLNEWSYFNRGLHLHFDGAVIDKMQISPPAR